MIEALSLINSEGCRLAFGGITLYRRPMAYALALLAQHAQFGHPRNLRMLSFTAGLESDILLGKDLVSQVRTCYFGLEVFGFAPRFTRLANRGEIEIVEESEASLAYGLRASLAGVGFMPSPAWQGTDMLRLREDVKSIRDPYTGEQLTAFPAISVDVAIVHALRANPAGDADIGKHWGVDRELALVADTVIVTAEEIVEELDKADIIGPVVDAVVEAPRGAWPTSCHPLYTLDGLAILDYLQAEGEDGFAQVIHAWAEVHGIEFPS
jgi:glutaconate CoA-transferase subunit A